MRPRREHCWNKKKTWTTAPIIDVGTRWEELHACVCLALTTGICYTFGLLQIVLPTFVLYVFNLCSQTNNGWRTYVTWSRKIGNTRCVRVQPVSKGEIGNVFTEAWRWVTREICKEKNHLSVSYLLRYCKSSLALCCIVICMICIKWISHSVGCVTYGDVILFFMIL